MVGGADDEACPRTALKSFASPVDICGLYDGHHLWYSFSRDTPLRLSVREVPTGARSGRLWCWQCKTRTRDHRSQVIY